MSTADPQSARLPVTTGSPAGPRRTLDMRTSGDPLDPHGVGSMIKPAELVDVVEISALNRSELVLYNQLLANAWNNIGSVKVHRISKSVLRGSHESNDRLHEAFDKLMGAFAKVRHRHPETGRSMTTRVNLLGPNTEEDADDGYFYYTFHEQLLRILQFSSSWARIKTNILYLLRSKYSVRLYEIVERRINMHAQSQTFSVDDLRALLGVPDDKLTRFSDFNKYALKPAIDEVNLLTDYAISVGVRRKGRAVHQLELMWIKKDLAAVKAAAANRDVARARRKGRPAQIEIIH